jgi:proline iminopeptidase
VMNSQSTGRFRDEYLAPIPEAERRDLILAYHAQLNSVDEETRVKAAKAWSKWE